MKSIVLGMLLTSAAFAQMADYPVISELRYYETSGVNEEFVEIYNPTNFTVDMSGWKLQYKSSTGVNWLDKLTFTAGQQIAPHSFLLYGGTSCETAPDFPSSSNPGLGNSGGHVRILDDTQTEVDRVAWGAADSPEGTALGSHARGASFERKAFENSTVSDMLPGGAHHLEGNAWDAANNNADFVTHDLGNSAPQNGSSSPEPDEPLTDGSGTASCSITQIYAPDPADFTITVAAGEHELPTVAIELPEGWMAASVSLSGPGFDGAMLENIGQTWTATDCQVMDDDMGTFSLEGVTYPTASGPSTINVLTAVESGTPSVIAAPPVIQVIGDPIPMSDLHNLDGNGLPFLLGQTVVVRGVVTTSTQFGIASYMQDETGGIVCYDSGFANGVNVGDDVSVLGVVTHFNGLVELTPATLLETHGSGVTVEPEVLTCADIDNQGASGEPWEGMLVRINGILVEGSGSWAGNSNYTISDASGSSTLRINSGSELVGAPIPAGTVDMIGVVGQYDFSAPHHSGFQIQPRFLSDQIQTAGPGIAAGPFESGHNTDSVTISWQTQAEGSTVLVYGEADGTTLDSLTFDNHTTDHEHTLAGLDSGTPYWARVGATNEDGTSMAGTYWFSTVSEGSPGTIEVFFTHDVDHEYATPGNEANGDHDVTAEVISLIDNAETSLDCAIYSLNIFAVADAIINAHDRGVAVRFIYDSDHSQGEVAQIENAGITVIDNGWPNNSTDGIQHNKFIIADAADADPANDRVWTGSLNLIDEPSGYGIHAKQNSVLIADQAIARTYTLEFNEMWGSDTMTPSAVHARFGEYKTNNTPKHFFVGGIPVDVLFSQGDNVSQRIVNYISDADESVYFCILSFTRNEINYAMQDAYDASAAVRGVFNTEGDEYSEWGPMQTWGADIHVDSGTGILHHKYMVIDSEEPDSDPTVITGSYNWSNSAEYSNDENVVVIHDADIANQYLQEFALRYHTAGGTADFNDITELERPGRFQLSDAYPNPFNPSTTLEFQLPLASTVRMELFNMKGQLIQQFDLGQLSAGNHHHTLDLSGHASGLYLLRAESNSGSDLRKLLFVK